MIEGSVAEKTKVKKVSARKGKSVATESRGAEKAKPAEGKKKENVKFFQASKKRESSSLMAK